MAAQILKESKYGETFKTVLAIAKPQANPEIVLELMLAQYKNLDNQHPEFKGVAEGERLLAKELEKERKPVAHVQLARANYLLEEFTRIIQEGKWPPKPVIRQESKP